MNLETLKFGGSVSKFNKPKNGLNSKVFFYFFIFFLDKIKGQA